MTIQKSLIMSHHHVFYLLLLVIQVTCQSQPGTTGPPVRTNPASTVIIGMLLSTLVFSLLACCICYKYSGSPPHGTNSDIEEGGRDVRTRRTSRGLENDVVKSFPSFVYSQVKGLKIGKGGVECAICLNEFEDDETLRLMPPCSHVFHADCIDVWLSSRATCPVCRAKLGADQDSLYSFVSPHAPARPNRVGSAHINQDMDLETRSPRRSVLESPDVRLLDRLVVDNMATRPPRSRSTRSPNWRITDLIFPRSHTTGHSLVPLGENLDRFTLQLPEEVKIQLSHKTLPQARSSRQGYRSGSVGSEPNGRRSNRKTVSLSFSLSFQMTSLQLSKGKETEVGECSF